MRKITTSAHMPTEIKVENVSENVAKIIAYPFETGYAVTLAHPLRRLLLLNFHNSHEDIVDLFQTMWNNSTKNIPILLKAIDNIPEYLEPEDFKYPYIRKIIYAIGAQPQPESFLALEKLASETNDIKIKELALHQLQKRKELGRWEYEKNR